MVQAWLVVSGNFVRESETSAVFDLAARFHRFHDQLLFSQLVAVWPPHGPSKFHRSRNTTVSSLTGDSKSTRALADVNYTSHISLYSPTS
ncbi:hypothetical protein BDN67DRAFT_248016 [Paxillus ammoniavirescens]|nr:hypothetical protein BDN67DRAFT_248016 [Paxillus ammoniavirescens]